MNAERLNWIRTWTQGWRGSVLYAHSATPGGIDYSILALDVATSMIEELLGEVERLSTEARIEHVSFRWDEDSREVVMAGIDGLPLLVHACRFLNLNDAPFTLRFSEES